MENKDKKSKEDNIVKTPWINRSKKLQDELYEVMNARSISSKKVIRMKGYITSIISNSLKKSVRELSSNEIEKIEPFIQDVLKFLKSNSYNK